jgi:hypothetical protein
MRLLVEAYIADLDAYLRHRKHLNKGASKHEIIALKQNIQMYQTGPKRPVRLCVDLY